MAKQYSLTHFHKNGWTFTCWSENTRYGFRHLCYATQDGHEGWEPYKGKRCYYNRTWERYQFQSVLQDCADHIRKDYPEIEFDF